MDTYFTLDSGRMHIAQGAHYAGSVNTYNNMASRAVARLFWDTVWVQMGGEPVLVDRKSYKDWLASVGELHGHFDLNRYLNVDLLLSQVSVSGDMGYMRHQLSSSTQNKLTQELALAIFKGDQSAAKQALGQGADVDSVFYDRQRASGVSQFSWKISSGLASNRAYSFKAREGTAIAHAAKRNLHSLVAELKRFGADNRVQLSQWQFDRSISHVSHEPYVYTRYRRGHVAVRGQVCQETWAPHIALRYRTVVHYTDTVKLLQKDKLKHLLG